MPSESFNAFATEFNLDEPRDIWYSIKYKVVGKFNHSQRVINTIAYAAIMHHHGPGNIGSAPDDMHRRGLHYAVQDMPCDYQHRVYDIIFQDDDSYTYVATVFIRDYFRSGKLKGDAQIFDKRCTPPPEFKRDPTFKPLHLVNSEED